MKRFLFVVVAACGGSGGGAGDHVVAHPAPPGEAPAHPARAMPPPKAGPPVARIANVRDTYHGVTVDDPYRWLEGNGPDVKAWSDGQNTYARGILDKLPDVGALRTEVAAILDAPITTYRSTVLAGRRYFAARKRPDRQQAELIVFDDPTKVADAKLILDPTAGGNPHRAIDWFVPSPDGKRVAVSLSVNGSEAGDLHIFDTTGREVGDVIPNVQRGTGGGSVAWTSDSKSFYYTRYPSAGEKPDDERDFWMQVWFHTLGTPVAKDHYELGKDFPKIAEILLESDRRGRVLAKIQKGDGNVFQHYLHVGKTWRQLTDWRDGVVHVGFGSSPDLWAISIAGAPRGKVLRIPARGTLAKARVVVPEAADAIVSDYYDDRGVVESAGRIYLTYQTGGPEALRAFTLAGKPAKAPALPPVSANAKPIAVPGGVLVSAASYTTPTTMYRFDSRRGTTTTIEAMSPEPPVDLSGVEAIRDTATSKDGTKVPFTVLWPRKAPRDGSTRCLASGYGGYSSSETPRPLFAYAPLLSRGVCVVRTNLRGGAEFGDAWHRAGMLTQKQHVFDDFDAVLTTLVERKYTSRDKLAIIGGSNGGLLMGAIVTQHPDHVKAVVSSVGIYDMLRTELSPNGAYNVTEYGTVKDPAQFAALYAYSPYHHVTPHTRYPAILMSTGDNDPRVSPWQSRKFTAALQAAQAGDAPILLETSATAGHGIGTSTRERIDNLAQAFAFVLWQLK